MEVRLTGKQVLVTGGSRGIGRATATALAEAGAAVTVCHRRHGAADDASNPIPGEASNGHDGQHAQNGHRAVPADITRPDDVQRLVQDIRGASGRIDVLVNNVGEDAVGLFDSVDDDEWRRVLEVNLVSAARVTRSVLPLLPRGAAVVTIAAAAAARGVAGRVHYGASKAGLIGFTRSLAKELGPRGIRVNAVSPGIVLPAGEEPSPLHARIASMTALGRLGAPADVADVVLFLASDLARYITGATLVVDGGL